MPRSTSSSGSHSRTSSFGSSISSRPSSHGSSRPIIPGIRAPHPTPIGSPVLQPMPQPSFGQTIKDGFGFGIGSAIAHRIFGGSRVVEHVHTTSDPSLTESPTTKPQQAQKQSHEYVQCMKESKQDAEACKHLLDSA